MSPPPEDDGSLTAEELRTSPLSVEPRWTLRCDDCTIPVGRPCECPSLSTVPRLVTIRYEDHARWVKLNARWKRRRFQLQLALVFLAAALGATVGIIGWMLTLLASFMAVE